MKWRFVQTLCVATLFGVTVEVSRAEDWSSEVDRGLASWVSVFEKLHASPELSYQEKETSAFLAERLRQLGFEVTEGVGRYPAEDRVSYGVVAVMKNGPGPTVMVRTDTDALPVVEKNDLPYRSEALGLDDSGQEVGVMHACGHDLHMVSFLGTAELLSRMKSRWSGTLVMIAQPAEERGAGALAMLEDGLYTRFPRPDYVLALHTSAIMAAGTVGVRSGYSLANVDSVDILVRGKGGHGAWPHTTKDPSHPGGTDCRQPSDHRQSTGVAASIGRGHRWLDPRRYETQHHSR